MAVPLYFGSGSVRHLEAKLCVAVALHFGSRSVQGQLIVLWQSLYTLAVAQCGDTCPRVPCIGLYYRRSILWQSLILWLRQLQHSHYTLAVALYFGLVSYSIRTIPWQSLSAGTDDLSFAVAPYFGSRSVGWHWLQIYTLAVASCFCSCSVR